MSEHEPSDAFGLLRSFIAHRAHLADGLRTITDALEHRGHVHDLSKLRDDEFGGFCRINSAARVHKFGSPEYAEGMRRERHTIDLHFSRNRHHPEYWSDGTTGNEWAATSMTFLDVIEMVVDWWAARKGYDDARPWAESFDLNLKHKGKYLSPEQVWLARSVADFLGTCRE